jgi:hypothetical protein
MRAKQAAVLLAAIAQVIAAIAQLIGVFRLPP